MQGVATGAAGPRTLMNVERIAWSVTILIGLVAAVLFFHNGFQGYGTLSVLLALAASVNLAPSKNE